jgi:hypothetical protein
MGATTSSYATAGIVLRVSGALKPHHHDKVETPSMGTYLVLTTYHSFSVLRGLVSKLSRLYVYLLDGHPLYIALVCTEVKVLRLR